MGLYQVGQFVSRSFLSSMYKVEVIGKENIPDEGGVILCCNHLSNLDPPFLGAYIKRPIHYMAKKELFEKPILKSLLPKIKAFPVRRGMSDKRALRTALNLVHNGEMIGLFPEGKRSTDGELGRGLAGAGFLALRTEATIIPCAIIGPYKPLKKIKLVYGQAIDFSQLRANKVSADEATSIIMEHIGELMENHKTTI